MADMDTKGGKRRNKRWPDALKREIVAATLAPGGSVSVVARQYDVNANQVFGWRRLYRKAGEPLPTLASSSRLVPVTVTPEPEDAPVAPSTPTALDTIEIEVSGRYRVRVGPGFEAAALRRVLDVLRRI